MKRIETEQIHTLSKYADSFTGLGCITDIVHHIQIDPEHEPVVVHPPRKVPVTIRSKVKGELQRMERLEVIERVHEPTDWVNSMVTVVKPNGKLRICIDPKDLNKAIKREYYPTCNNRSGFWQLKLDDQMPSSALSILHLGDTCSSGSHSESRQLKMSSKLPCLTSLRTLKVSRCRSRC